MYYVVMKQSPIYHQMSLEEFLFQPDTVVNDVNPNLTNTRTYEVEEVSERLLRRFPSGAFALTQKLAEFNRQTENLRSVPRHDLYTEFYIPKKSGGLRRIDAPNDELMDALRRLKTILETDFRALYHTSAFAYVKKRSTIDALKRHQANESKWYAKYDLHNFFGSTTLEFLMRMLSMIFPFSEVIRSEEGKRELMKALELGFLDGGLPQGTPLSPLITNIMMIPIDYKLSNKLRDFNKQHYIYTRYADDFQISSRYAFSYREVENLLKQVLAEFNAPFSINSEKTRYGSSAGRNWNLGCMVCNGADGKVQITVGHKKKRQFKAMLNSYILDRKNGISWDKSDVQVLEGYRNYYRMVEGGTIDEIVSHLGEKYQVDVLQMIKADLRP